MENLLVNKATNYTDNGFSVIPVKSDKSPALRSWTPFQKNRMVNGQIQRYFTQSSTKGIAIVCGAISGNLEVIDVDLKYDTDNVVKNEFPELIKESCSDLYDKLVVVETKNKGWHIPYRCEQIEGNQKLAKNQTGEVLLETRGEGGYVISPPTPGYCFLKRSYSEIPLLTNEERDTLLNLARSFDETGSTNEKGIYGLPEDDENTIFGNFNRHADVPQLLEENGWTRVNQRGEKIFYRRPGKETGISANWDIKRRIFYNFSTSTDFEVKGYSAIGIFATLLCNGDFRDASQRLEELGYGQRKTEQSLEHLSTPKFPISGLPEFVQGFLNTCIDVFGTPIDFWAASVISAAALAIGNKLELITRYQNIPILWMGITGDVSSGKTEAQRICLQPFYNLDKQLFSQYEDEVREYKRLSKLSEQDRLAEGVPILIEPKRFQYVVNDYTPEALAKIHSTNDRGLIIDRDELVGWLDDFNRYNKSGEMSFMLSSFNRVTKSINRKNSEDVVINKPVILIIGGIQPALLSKLAKDDGDENGFLQRFMFAYPDDAPKQEYSKERLPEDLVQDYERFIVSLTELSQIEKMYLSDEAETMYANWFNENVKQTNAEANRYIRGVNGKLEIIALRLAVVIKGMNKVLKNDVSNLITEDIMRYALELTEYFRATASKVYNKIYTKQPKDVNNKVVVQYLYRTTKLNKSQIANHLGIHRQQVQRWTYGITKESNDDGTVSKNTKN